MTLPVTPVEHRLLWFKDGDGSAAGTNIRLIGKAGGNGSQIDGADNVLINTARAGGLLQFTHACGWCIMSNKV